MNNELILEWDEEKRISNLVKHGVDFIDAIDIFNDLNMTLYVDKRKDYGEERFNAYGISKNRCLRLCFTRREDKIRVITMFRVHNKEWRNFYGNS